MLNSMSLLTYYMLKLIIRIAPETIKEIYGIQKIEIR